MKVAVLFDGAGLARLGLEQAGFDCIGFEADPLKVELSRYVGEGNVELADATKVDLSDFEIVWASPPCQWLSFARTQGDPISEYADNLLQWSLNLSNRWLWVENVYTQGARWGTVWNAAQFTPSPLQNRNRIVGGRYITPQVYRAYRQFYPDASPAILATEYKGSRGDPRRASRIAGRRLTMHECARYQGFEIPIEWHSFHDHAVYEAIGNAVPVYFARAFGEALIGRLQ